MRHAPRSLLAGGLGLATAFLVACGGGSGLLSADQASSLNTQLDQVSAAIGAGQCSAADSAASGFTNAVSNLSATGVNSKLVANLQQGAGVVAHYASRDCRTASTTTSSRTTSAPSSPSSTTSTTETSTSTSTSTPTSTATSSSPTSTSAATSSTGSGTSTSKGDGGAGVGTGNGNGNGGGNGGNGH